MNQTETLNLIVPCYNPINGWEDNLITCFNLFKNSLKQEVRLILINDGSTQGVDQAHLNKIKAAIANFTYHTYPKNKGKGHALREGIKKATSSLSLTTDIDFPYENHSMVKVAEKLNRSGGLVLGHRSSNYYRKVPLFRKLLSLSFRLALKSLLHLNVDDTQCGLKGMDESVMRAFHKTQVNGYLYDLELVTIVQKEHIPVHRVEVDLKSGVEFTNMRMSILIKELRNFLIILRKS